MNIIYTKEYIFVLGTRIRQMPPKLEALVRGKNTYAMHERSQ